MFVQAAQDGRSFFSRRSQVLAVKRIWRRKKLGGKVIALGAGFPPGFYQTRIRAGSVSDAANRIEMIQTHIPMSAHPEKGADDQSRYLPDAEQVHHSTLFANRRRA